MVSVKCLGKGYYFKVKEIPVLLLWEGRWITSVKAECFMRCRKLKIHLNILKWSWALWSLPPMSSACPCLWKKLKPKKKLNQTSPVKSHEELTPSFSKEKLKVSENFQKSVSLLWTAAIQLERDLDGNPWEEKHFG